MFGQIYRPGLEYKKASVTLLEMKDAKAVQSQGLLDSDDQTPERRQQDTGLMESVDRINHLLGPGKLFFGAQGTTQNWRGASDHCSPGYTTNWRELPVVKAK